MRHLPRLIPLLAVFAAVLSFVGHAAATQELQEKMAELAVDILKNTNDQPVTVGQFSPTAAADANSGPGIEAMLTACLQTIGAGKVAKDAAYEVKGDYGLVKSKINPELREIKLSLRLIEKETGEELKDLRITCQMTGTNTIAELLQITTSLPPNGEKLERNKELVKSLQNPSVHIYGPSHSICASTPASEYGIEIYCKPLADHANHKAEPRGASVEDGLAFVGIERDELYEVKLYNNSDADVAAALSIDGLSVFHFSHNRDPQLTSKPAFSHFIIPKHNSLTVVGWHNSLDGPDNFLSFLVTEYGKGASSKAGIPATGVGVIHCQFSKCLPLGAKGVRSASNETGFGPPREVKQQPVKFEIEPPHDFISVRYQR